jgi:hypothetical protein
VESPLAISLQRRNAEASFWSDVTVDWPLIWVPSAIQSPLPPWVVLNDHSVADAGLLSFMKRTGVSTLSVLLALSPPVGR